jgi:hypothetical protein
MTLLPSGIHNGQSRKEAHCVVVSIRRYHDYAPGGKCAKPTGIDGPEPWAPSRTPTSRLKYTTARQDPKTIDDVLDGNFAKFRANRSIKL